MEAKKQITKILRVILVFAVLCSVFTFPCIVKADSYSYAIDVTVSNNTSSAMTFPFADLGIAGSGLVSAGYLNADGTNLRFQEGDTNRPLTSTTTKTAMTIDSLSAHQSRSFKIKMAYSPVYTASSYVNNLVVGTGGSISTSDNATIELGSVFQIDAYGYFDTSAGASKNILYKNGAFQLYVSAAGTIAAIITYDTGTITASGAVASGVHTIRVTADGTNLKLYCDDMVTAIATTSQLHNHAQTTSQSVGGAGYTTGIAGMVGAPTHWQAVQTNDADTSYVCNDDGGYQWDYYTVDLSAVPSSATITNVKIYMEMMGSAGSACYVKPATRLNATNAEGTAINFTGTGSGNVIEKIQTMNRPGGGSWTRADLVDATFQIGLGIAGPGIVGQYCYCTQVFPYIEYTVPTASACVDNGNAYVWMQNNAMPYAYSLAITVSGVEKLLYKPAKMLTATTIDNSDSTLVDVGTITFGTTTTGLVVTIGGIYPYTTPTPTVATSLQQTVPTATMPTGWFNSGANMVNLPLYDIVDKAATDIGWNGVGDHDGTKTIYTWMQLATASAVGLGVLLFSGSLTIAFASLLVTEFAGWNSTVLDGWIVFVTLFMGLALMYLYNQR